MGNVATAKPDRSRAAAGVLASLAVVTAIFSIGAAFIPPKYEYGAGLEHAFCPVPALYDQAAFSDSMNDRYLGAPGIVGECGAKIDHRIRLSVGAMTLTVPAGLLALFLRFRRRTTTHQTTADAV